MARNPYTKPTRRTNRDIYEEELKKLEKLQERAAKYGIQDNYKPSKAKRITQKQIKGIQARGIALKSEIKKAQTRQRNERRRQKRNEERKSEKINKSKAKSQKPQEQKAKEAEKRAQANLLKELQKTFPAPAQEKITEPDVFPWGDLASLRFQYILSEIDSAIDVLQRSKRYSEYPIEELRDLLVEWYQDDPAEMLSELFATDTMQQLQTKDQLYSAVETGEIYALMERLTSEHDRLRQIHVVEDFGLLED